MLERSPGSVIVSGTPPSDIACASDSPLATEAATKGASVRLLMLPG